MFHERYLDAVRQIDAEAFAAAQARGRELTTSEAIALAASDSAAAVDAAVGPAEEPRGPRVALAS